jgi:anti-anti-sigma factor
MSDLQRRSDPPVVERVELFGEYDLARTEELIDVLVLCTTGTVVSADMRSVRFIDSSGISALITSQSRLELEGRHLALVNVSDRTYGLLEMLRLGDFLDVHCGDEV